MGALMGALMGRLGRHDDPAALPIDQHDFADTVHDGADPLAIELVEHGRARVRGERGLDGADARGLHARGRDALGAVGARFGQDEVAFAIRRLQCAGGLGAGRGNGLFGQLIGHEHPVECDLGIGRERRFEIDPADRHAERGPLPGQVRQAVVHRVDEIAADGLPPILQVGGAGAGDEEVVERPGRGDVDRGGLEHAAQRGFDVIAGKEIGGTVADLVGERGREQDDAAVAGQVAARVRGDRDAVGVGVDVLQSAQVGRRRGAERQQAVVTRQDDDVAHRARPRDGQPGLLHARDAAELQHHGLAFRGDLAPVRDRPDRAQDEYGGRDRLEADRDRLGDRAFLRVGRHGLAPMVRFGDRLWSDGGWGSGAIGDRVSMSNGTTSVRSTIRVFGPTTLASVSIERSSV